MYYGAVGSLTISALPRDQKVAGLNPKTGNAATVVRESKELTGAPLVLAEEVIFRYGAVLWCV